MPFSMPFSVVILAKVFSSKLSKFIEILIQLPWNRHIIESKKGLWAQRTITDGHQSNTQSTVSEYSVQSTEHSLLLLGTLQIPETIPVSDPKGVQKTQLKVVTMCPDSRNFSFSLILMPHVPHRCHILILVSDREGEKWNVFSACYNEWLIGLCQWIGYSSQLSHISFSKFTHT